jgi:hypothetical protein
MGKKRRNFENVNGKKRKTEATMRLNSRKL